MSHHTANYGAGVLAAAADGFFRPKTTHDKDRREGGSSCPICTWIYPAPIPSR